MNPFGYKRHANGSVEFWVDFRKLAVLAVLFVIFVKLLA